MVDIEYTDNSVAVKSAIASIAYTVLDEVGAELLSRIKRNSRKDTSDTRNSYEKVVTGSMMAEKFVCTIGSDRENAIWEEFGTGEYALNGDGRKGAWYVPVESVSGSKKPTFNGQVVIVHGKGGQDFYMTNGKTPKRPMYTAYTKLKDKLIKHIQQAFAEGLK